MGTKGPTVTGSAAIHAERIRAAEAERAGRAQTPTAPSTAEHYAARILPGYRADAELRRQAAINDKRARGEWVPGDESADADETEDEDFEVEVDEEEGDEEEVLSTADRYAARERERIKAERAANQRAWAGTGAHLAEQARWMVG